MKLTSYIVFAIFALLIINVSAYSQRLNKNSFSVFKHNETQVISNFKESIVKLNKVVGQRPPIIEAGLKPKEERPIYYCACVDPGVCDCTKYLGKCECKEFGKDCICQYPPNPPKAKYEMRLDERKNKVVPYQDGWFLDESRSVWYRYVQTPVIYHNSAPAPTFIPAIRTPIMRGRSSNC